MLCSSGLHSVFPCRAGTQREECPVWPKMTSTTPALLGADAESCLHLHRNWMVVYCRDMYWVVIMWINTLPTIPCIFGWVTLLQKLLTVWPSWNSLIVQNGCSHLSVLWIRCIGKNLSTVIQVVTMYDLIALMIRTTIMSSVNELNSRKYN